jgi:methyl-accepting chemotaxis protein
MRIRAKIFLFIIITSSVIFAGVIGFIIFRYRTYSLAEANRLANIYAQNASDKIKAALEKDLSVCETVSQSFSGLYNDPSIFREKIYSDILTNVLKGHPEYLSVWMSWELKYIKPGYTSNYGRKRTVTIREAGIVKTYIDTTDLSGDNLESVYYQSKISKKDMLVDPYYYKYSKENAADSVFETSIAKPIILDGEFAGLVGIDLTFNRFQEMVNQVKPFEDSRALLVSNNGLIISDINQKNSGDSILKAFPVFLKYDALNQVKKSDKFSFTYKDSVGISNYVSLSQIKVGNSETPWIICIIAPTTSIDEKVINNFNISLIIGLAGILIFSLITILIVQNIISPLQQATSILKDLDKGIIDFSRKLKARSRDELGEMGRSINNLMETLYKTADFAKKIGQGDFNTSYQALSQYDVLGNALIDMQNNLRSGQEQEEIRQLERQKTTWAQEGLSELGEVLRNSGDNFEDYLFSILSQIVKILKADQGAIFLLNSYSSEKPFLELMTSYAYEKRKSLQDKVEIGESLVGRCFQEKEIIYMTNIPEGYTFISSGLGSESPRCLFLMPLLFEDEPFGVIELASFRQFADFEIEFLKSTGERVASSISIMQKNVQTKELLAQYKLQSDELSMREKMMQENLLELQKIQEDAIVKEKETEGIIEALSNVGSITWYDLNGKIIDIKDKNLRLIGITEQSIIGKKHSEMDKEAREEPAAYKEFWEDIKKGNSRKRVLKTETRSGLQYISELYAPIFNKEGNPDKIINIAINITEQKILEEEINKLKEEIEQLKKQP